MRKIVPIFVVSFFVLSGLGAVGGTESNEENLISKEIFFSTPKIMLKEEYVSLEISEANSFIMEKDKPMLPSYVHTFTFPYGTKINSVTCNPYNINQKTISKQIIPTPKAYTAGMVYSKAEKSTINYGNEPYPNVWYNYDVGCGMKDQERCIIVKVNFYPVKYFPNEGIIKYAENAEINVNYETSVISNNFIDEYKFVVIGPSEFSDELAPLVTHKISRGISTIFVTLNEIHTGVHFPATGRDDQERIKYFIKKAIEGWNTEFVVLVGGIDKLPARETHVKNGDDEEIFVSDLYYADIYNETMGFCSWDSNGNDVFGEYNWGASHNYDEVDLYPDVYFGRLACVVGSEVTTCVNKIKTYEDNEAFSKHWFNDMVVIGGDHAPGDTDGVPEGEFVNEKIIDVMAGFVPNRVWDSNGRLSGILPTGVAEITDAIETGCGFVDFSGHGNPSVWATHPYEDETKWIPTPYGHYLNSKVQSLNNGNKLPIVIVGACSTFKFNKNPHCFGWSFMFNNNGGGIACCGATGLDWFYLGEYVIQKGFEKICIDSFQAYKDGAMTFGEMWSGALEGYIYPGLDALDHKTVEEFQSFGDPTLAIKGDSQAPNKPAKPTGPINGGVGKTYTYETSTTDPETDQIYYLFDWDDGTTSGWFGPFNSGDTASADHKWSSQGNYFVKAIAKDENGVISVWSDPLPVSIPKSKAANTPWFNFLENYPHMFPLLQLLLQRLGVF
jgi:hypothetical protein